MAMISSFDRLLQRVRADANVLGDPLRIALPTAAPLPRLVAAAAQGDADASASLLAFMERTARDQGFGDVIDVRDREAVALVLGER
jgi:hypothetical protein